MGPNSRKPLLIALGIASVLAIVVSLILYLNEDLRRSTFVMLEKTVNEKGEEEIRVKVEKPKPNKEQVEKISRLRERQKRDKLKEKAEEIRKTVKEMEQVAEALRQKLSAKNEWSAIVELADKLDASFDSLTTEFADQKTLENDPDVLPAIFHMRRQMRELLKKVQSFVEVKPDTDEAGGYLVDVRKMTEDEGAVRGRIMQDAGKWTLTRREKINETDRLGQEYLKAVQQVVGEPPAVGIEPDDSAIPEEDSEEFEPDILDFFPTDAELENMTAGELYESIQDMTQLMDGVFAENRATELAMMENITMEQAADRIYAPKTDTGPDIGKTLDAMNPANLEQFQKYSEMLNQVERFAENMARTAANRLGQVAPAANADRKATQTAQQLRKAIQQRAQTRSQMQMLADNAGREKGNVQDMRALMAQSYQNGFSGSQGSEEVGGVLSQTFNTSMDSGGGRSGKEKASAPVRLGLNQVLQQAIPGRRLDQNASRKGWVFIDTWYIIGPWDRPKTDSFDSKFPPETAIDLDATYPGKTNPKTKKLMSLEWHFVQTENIRVNPPDEISDAVYYAYTEVFAERAMEVMVAVASDDLAKLWINDFVVWQDEGLSAWRLDEGFRRILLKPGYNKVLVRVENGPAVCYFSVLMCPMDQLQAVTK